VELIEKGTAATNLRQLANVRFPDGYRVEIERN